MDLKFIIPKPLLNIPSLEMICRNLQTNIIKELRAYSHEFKLMLTKHLTTETEVQIVDGLVTAESDAILQILGIEWGMLQYRNRLLLILTRWKNKLCGQPINQFTGGQIDSNIEDIINKFEDYIYEIQSSALKTMRSKDNALCKNVITK